MPSRTCSPAWSLTRYRSTSAVLTFLPTWCFCPTRNTRSGTTSSRDRARPAGCPSIPSGRSTVSSDSSLLRSAITAHHEAIFRYDLPTAMREKAARRFRAVIAELDETRAALPPFVAALAGEDMNRRSAAARALVATHWSEATVQLLRAYAMQGP